MNIEEFNKKDILGDFEYELNKLCRSCIGTATEIKIKQQPLINLFEEIVWAYEKEKEKNKKIENELEKHIKFCEQEAEGSLNNEICHIALKFNKGLLDIINEEE